VAEENGVRGFIASSILDDRYINDVYGTTNYPVFFIGPDEGGL
jgi:hypothetical protein